MATVPSIGRAAPEGDLTRALYEQYAAQIYRYCLHQLGSREEAEDAVQSTFLNAFRGLKRGVVPEVESAWLFKIAHNVCLSRRRSTWRRGRIESPADFEIVEELAPAPSRRAEELIGLQDVLEQMPEQQRRAILLREWQGLSYREIGEELELSQAAVETLIFRARRALAQGLEQPPAAQRRVRRGAGVFGNLASWAQSFLFGGGAVVKVAATVAVVGAGAVVATAPVQHSPARRTPPAIAPAIAPSVARPGRPVVAPAASRPRTMPRAAHDVAPPAPAAAASTHTATDTTAVVAPATEAPPQEPQEPQQQQSAGDAPAAATGRAQAPGQAKEQHAAAQPPAAQTTPASSNGNGKGNANGQANGNAPAAPPGQAKTTDPAAQPPGQAKKTDPAPVVPDVQPPVAATPPAVVPAPPVDTPAPPAAPGQGNGSGQGNGNGQGNGSGSGSGKGKP